MKKKQELEDWIGIEKIKEKDFGFIYMITEISSGKKYIGKKNLEQVRTKLIGGKKRKVRSESDWRKYFSSNDYLKKKSKVQCDDLRREILFTCKSKGELNYMETRELFKHNVLENDMWFNENIASRYFKKNVLKYVTSK